MRRNKTAFKPIVVDTFCKIIDGSNIWFVIRKFSLIIYLQIETIFLKNCFLYNDDTKFFEFDEANSR